MSMLALTIILSLIGFVLLAFSHGHWSESASATIGVGSVGLAALVTVLIGVDFFANGEQSYSQPPRTWTSVGDLNIGLNLVLDGLSLAVLSVVTGVDFLIHMYTSWYMRGEEDYFRFFAYTSLLIASMVVLVLIDNLPSMHLGWEGVGLRSHLLIGFCYTDPKSGAAAMKAFVATRVGDVLLTFVLFILYNELGTPDSREMVKPAPTHFTDGNNMLMWATLMLLGSAVGKSAQLPLQTWFADVVTGPTPVSTLIRAATMVTVGVYLIARTHGPFLMTPEVLHPVSIVGTVTLLLAGFAALVQTDIRRALAYSTVSQVGYVFPTPNMQVWDAAIFHLMTHALFKVLLLLASGSIILVYHHEQNISRMGGLRKSIPLVYLCFLVDGVALSALPLVIVGFLSKDEILTGAMANGRINPMMAGLVGAFMISLYAFRMVFIAFHGREQIHAYAVKGVTHSLPLIVLPILSTFASTLIVPPLQGVFPQTTELAHDSILTPEITSDMVAVVSILLTAWLWLGKRTLVTPTVSNAPGRPLGIWQYNAWGLDQLYDKAFVKSFLGIA